MAKGLVPTLNLTAMGLLFTKMDKHRCLTSGTRFSWGRIGLSPSLSHKNYQVMAQDKTLSITEYLSSLGCCHLRAEVPWANLEVKFYNETKIQHYLQFTYMSQ